MPWSGGIRRRSEAAIDRDSRVLGLRDAELDSLEAIERRRLELWALMTVIVAAVGIAMFLVSGLSEVDFPFPSSALRIGIVSLALAFCAYSLEKELHLRRLTRMLVDERMLTHSLTNRVSELSELLTASRAMNSVLDVEEVLEIILSSAVDILHAEGGSIMLAEGDDLRSIRTLGNPGAESAVVRIGEGVVGQVAESREPVLITGALSPDDYPGRPQREQPVRSAMCVPLINRGELCGVINVNAKSEQTFNEHDLRALSVFAEQAAVAIANARLFEAEQERVRQLERVDEMKRQFIVGINHDLRTPLTILLGGAAVARRPGLSDEERDQFLGAVERQAQQLASMIDGLLVAAEIDSDPSVGSIGACDVVPVVQQLVHDLDAIGRAVRVRAPSRCVVSASENSIRRILSNLVDNAFKHGKPPVEIEVRQDASTIAISVTDHGDGIPDQHQGRVFDRFFRIDPNRTQPGMGLGLSIVKALVTACGGTIDVRSATGRTTFRVRLSAPANADGTLVADERERASADGVIKPTTGDAQVPREATN